jgi:hypothetical protein
MSKVGSKFHEFLEATREVNNFQSETMLSKKASYSYKVSMGLNSIILMVRWWKVKSF